MSILEAGVLKQLNGYLLDKPQPLIGAETIQLLLLREVHDYTMLRTEESREINSVFTPLSVSNRETVVRRVAFLGTKQKAAESRQLESMLRTANAQAARAIPECYLKDNLCLQCPRCGLYGATALSNEANIKHRIEYSTAFSLDPFDQVTEEQTFNAVNETDQRTGQALGSRPVVKPGTLFASIVTLRSVTRAELVLAVKTLLSCKSYGAESRIGGDCRNTIVGVTAGWEEIITPLELTLELYDIRDEVTAGAIETLLNENYRPLAGYPERVHILPASQIESFVRECAETRIDSHFLEKVYNDIRDYRASQDGKRK